MTRFPNPINLFTDLFYIVKKDERVLLSDAGFSEMIGKAIEDKTPFLAARIGATECSTLRVTDFGYEALQEKMVKQLSLWSGFFPEDRSLLRRFASIYEDAIGCSDVLFPMGYKGENYLIAKYADKNLEFYHDYFVNSGSDIWNRHLAGKTVLVIHPFADTIRSQYENYRDKLHKSADVLPLFELKTIKSVFTAGGERDNRFSDWFEALDYMHSESRKIDYDVALIGCGAYGFPLAARIKKDGKVAVHMGGSLQLLFGIKGSRWEQGLDRGANLYNEYWTYAAHSERPQNFALIEGKSYWEAP